MSIYMSNMFCERLKQQINYVRRLQLTPIYAYALHVRSDFILGKSENSCENISLAIVKIVLHHVVKLTKSNVSVSAK
jgi:predicted component of viral defense system (DUF524 family)